MFSATWKPLFLCFLLLFVAVKIQGQSLESNITGYSCSDGPSPCNTYVFFKADAPNYLDLVNISDLFYLSRLIVAKANNLSYDTTSLVEGQPLLIPVICGCMANYSQANITYEFKPQDTIFLVSRFKFQYLTTYQAVEVANPSLIPTLIPIGTPVTFPIRCQCPSQAQISKGIKMQITYVVQEADTLKSISQKFCANLEDLSSQNGISSSSTIFPNTTILVPVSEKPILAPPPPSVPSSSLGTNNGSHGLSRLRGIVIGGSLGGAVVLLALALWVIWVVRNRALLHKSGNKITEEPNSPSNLKTTEELNSPSNLKAESLAVKTSQQEKLLASVISSIDKPCNYSIESLEKATQNFSPLCHIQGSVYKGTINGKNYAIKQMKGDISQELKILQKVNHSNLVKLEGFCIGSEGKSYLVYEYADNGTLNAWLHDPESIQNKIATSDLSSWKTRLQIALDVADGLQYIHEHTTPTVVHKDVNSRNILLDSKFRAKIANFAMAKSGINVCTRHIEGTPGYMAPEYLANGVVTPKLDVFAFGVVLLELISGKKAIVHEWGVPLGGNADLLWTQIKPLMEGEDREVKLRKWVDPDLHGVYPNDTVLCLADIAKACVDKDPGARPSLSEIVYRLSNALEAHLDKFDEIFENPNHDISR